MQASESVHWKNRKATRLTNGVVELIALTGGGHLADFRFLEQNGKPSPNTFWEAPWATTDPQGVPAESLPSNYGPLDERKFLAGYTGHALCLDYFCGPSPEQAAAGLSLHGEAASAWWNVNKPADSAEPACRWDVTLPFAQLSLEREIYLGKGESVAYVSETVTNQTSGEHVCDWVQHVTFGPPLLKQGESTLTASALRGRTGWPYGYGEGSMIADDQEFVWPDAPGPGGTVDLRQPFTDRGGGLIAGVQLDPRRAQQYVLAVNWKLRLGVGYCFRRDDFPWMTIWEENCARPDAPWNGTSQARGMEFGTIPVPRGPEEILRSGTVFDSPFQCVIPASGKKTAKYLIFLVTIPAGIDAIQNVETIGDTIVLYDQNGKPSLSVPASGCEAFLAP